MDTIKRNDEPLRELALFAGAGGGILGGQLLGWRTVCAVEYEPHARAVLCARQNDSCLEPFPIWDDVRTFDGTAWRGRVDIISGGFPCQDISCAGKGAGITGERSGLWGEMARIIGEIRPRYAWIENSPMLTLRGLDRVLCDLASMGYNATWGVVGASDAGACHARARLWIFSSDSLRNGLEKNCDNQELRDQASQNGRCRRSLQMVMSSYWSGAGPDFAVSIRVGDRMAIGLDADRLERIGNGQCPQAMALAWKILSSRVK